MLLNIVPGDLKFPFELKKQISASLRLENTSDEHVAFKVKTTSPKKYCVRPNTGVVVPHGSVEVTVTMQAQKEWPQDMQCKDKFLVQSVACAEGTPKEVPPELFSKESGRDIVETKLRVVYVSPPQPPSPITESPEEGLSPKAFSNDGSVEKLTDVSALQSQLRESRASLAHMTEERNLAKQKASEHQRELVSEAETLKSMDAKIAKAASSSKGVAEAYKGGKGGQVVQQARGFTVFHLLIVAILCFVLGYWFQLK